MSGICATNCFLLCMIMHQIWFVPCVDKDESLCCVAHTLQLIINDALFTEKRIEKVIKTCRKIVGHFRRSE